MHVVKTLDDLLEIKAAQGFLKTTVFNVIVKVSASRQLKSHVSDLNLSSIVSRFDAIFFKPD
jgi:hypothetical protein